MHRPEATSATVMSLSTWIQLLRNSFCVLKSLLPASSFLQRPYFTDSSFYPLTVTTCIELPIALTQFMAVLFNASSGYTNISDGRSDLSRMTNWLLALDRVFLADSSKFSGAEYLIIKHGLTADRIQSRTRVIVGVFELIFAVAFLFLVLNSLHIVGPTHPKPLIDALISMEIGLAYILVIMWKSFADKVKDFRRLFKLHTSIRSLKAPTKANLLIGAVDSGFKIEELYEVLIALDESYTPSWRAKSQNGCVGDVCTIKPLTITGEIQAEFKNVSAILAKLTAADASSKGSSLGTSAALRLRKQGFEAQLQAPLELLYFLLNFIAGYGYLLGILAFYVPEMASSHPLGMFDLLQNTISGTGLHYSWCKVLMFGLSHGDADWYGNLAGDIAWTVEPIVLLLNKPLITYLSNLEYSDKSRPVIKNTKKSKAE